MMPGGGEEGHFGDVAQAIGPARRAGSKNGSRQVSGAGEMALLGRHLHGMCQPLTAMQCRLEIGLMLGTLTGYEESVTESLRECERLMAAVQQMRQVISRALDRQ